MCAVIRDYCIAAHCCIAAWCVAIAWATYWAT
jgi:hypothetical protein